MTRIHIGRSRAGSAAVLLVLLGGCTARVQEGVSAVRTAVDRARGEPPQTRAPAPAWPPEWARPGRPAPVASPRVLPPPRPSAPRAPAPPPPAVVAAAPAPTPAMPPPVVARPIVPPPAAPPPTIRSAPPPPPPVPTPPLRPPPAPPPMRPSPMPTAVVRPSPPPPRPTAAPPRPPTPTFRVELLKPSPTIPVPLATAMPTPPPKPTAPPPAAAVPRVTPQQRDPLAALPPGYMPRATALTYRIPLTDLGNMGALDRSIAVTELVHAMRQNPKLELFLAAYVEDADVKARHADARSLADWLFLEVTRYFATRGVDPTRIRGKGMGVDPRVGRGIVAYLEFPPPSAKAPAGDSADEEPTPETEESSEALA